MHEIYRDIFGPPMIYLSLFIVSTLTLQSAYSEDLLMGHDVVIDACHDVDFKKQHLPPTMNISNAKLVCPGQITTIKAKVAHTHPAKQVSSKNLLMQNVVIVDPSGTILLTL